MIWHEGASLLFFLLSIIFEERAFIEAHLKAHFFALIKKYDPKLYREYLFQ